jgi:hypothetical protein
MHYLGLRVVSHRGNLNGPDPNRENNPSYIDKAINRFYEVEADIHHIEGSFYLGHNSPEYYVDLHWIKERKDYIIFHCKNKEALYLLKDGYHCFFHANDPYVLTSENVIWTYPGQPVGPGCIIVDLEPPNGERLNKYRTNKCLGVCTDYPLSVDTGIHTTYGGNTLTLV